MSKHVDGLVCALPGMFDASIWGFVWNLTIFAPPCRESFGLTGFGGYYGRDAPTWILCGCYFSGVWLRHDTFLARVFKYLPQRHCSFQGEGDVVVDMSYRNVDVVIPHAVTNVSLVSDKNHHRPAIA
jgi:hypothetical protein